jgi:hypothetical protein
MAKIRLMIDCETVGLEHNAGIVSIGITQFGLTDNQRPIELYEKCAFHSIESHQTKGFSISRETLAWWDKQAVHIRNDTFSGTQSIDKLIEKVGYYLDGAVKSAGDAKEVEFWSCGPMDWFWVENAFTQCNEKFPLPYRSFNDYRTIRNLMPAGTGFSSESSTHHNALADARYQAEIMDQFLRGFSWQSK